MPFTCLNMSMYAQTDNRMELMEPPDTFVGSKNRDAQGQLGGVRACKSRRRMEYQHGGTCEGQKGSEGGYH